MDKNERYLLDTHIFIWWMEKSKKLSMVLYNFLNDPDKYIVLSTASVWEMVIKNKRGKLNLPEDLRSDLEKSGFGILNIDLSHILKVGELPFFHHDPFDRLLVAQAKVENLTLITSDEKIQKYDLSILKI